MRSLLSALALIALPLAAYAQQQEKVLNVPLSDPDMAAAVTRAQRELPVFFGHVGSPGPGETGFLVKYDLIPGPANEFIWAEVISHANGRIVARLANTPVDPRFKLGQQVTLADGDVIDWAYSRNGVAQGHYTTRVLLARMSPAEAAPYRKALGL